MVADLCERYLRELRSSKIKDLAALRAGAATALKRLWPWLGRRRRHELTREDIEAALREAQTQYQPNPVRTSATKLQAVLSWAAKRRIIARSPATRIEKPSRATWNTLFLGLPLLLLAWRKQRLAALAAAPLPAAN